MRALIADCREMLSEQLEYRELLFQMTLRDLLLRYKQTIMGFGWAVFMPLLNTAVFTVIFTRVARIDTPVPYALFAFAGLWAWNFFASSLRFAVVSLTSNSSLVSKVYFPREIFPLSQVAVCFADFMIGSVVLAAFMAFYGVYPGVHILWLPVVMLVHVVFTAAMALLLAVANLFFRDVKYLFEMLITIWMFATPVVYPIDDVTGKLRLLIQLNPMTPIIEAYRSVLLLNTAPTPAFAAAAAGSVVLLGICWLVFHRLEFKFAETI
jgi:ABC-type polysaccharide/polyol phosphate export permease